MKKEEFFDTLEDVEQKYISEAFFDDLDDSLGVAKPGKARITPLKILAPIAACLALALGAAVGVPKLVKLTASPDDSSGEEIIAPNLNMVTNLDRGAYVPDCEVVMNFKAGEQEEAFVNDCMGIIANENPDIISDVTLWKICSFDSFCGSGANYDYLIQPMTDGHAIPEIGVRVFHKMGVYSSIYGETYDIADHGGFGKGYEGLDISEMVDDNFLEFHSYYYRVDVNDGVKIESIQMVSYDDLKTFQMVEEPILEKRDLGNRCLYYNNNFGESKSISEEEFIGTWNTYAFIPKFYTEFTTEEVDECREALKEAHGIPDTLKVLWREAEFDLDFDGTKELLLSPRNCEDVKGVYVFARTSSGIKEVGSFDTEIGYCQPEQVRARNVSAGNVFPYYYTVEHYVSSDSRINYVTSFLNKIVIDENGSITTETIAESGIRVLDSKNLKIEHYYILNGVEVSGEEFGEGTKNFTEYEEHKYYKPYVPTDPNNDAWD